MCRVPGFSWHIGTYAVKKKRAGFAVIVVLSRQYSEAASITGNVSCGRGYGTPQRMLMTKMVKGMFLCNFHPRLH
jgi:hypothetical protein